MNLPTGKKALTNDEIGIADLLTESFFNFPVKNYGEGFGINLEAGYAQNYDVYTYGVGMGYTLKTSYEPLQGTDNYNPGNMFRIGGYGSVELEKVLGRLSIVYNFYGEDKLDGTPVSTVGLRIRPTRSGRGSARAAESTRAARAASPAAETRPAAATGNRPPAFLDDAGAAALASHRRCR